MQHRFKDSIQNLKCAFDGIYTYINELNLNTFHNAIKECVTF